METFQNLLENIKAESDPARLKDLGMYDNFALLLNVTPEQQVELENLLEGYERSEDFEETFELFGSRHYEVEGTRIQYKYGSKGGILSAVFERKTGKKPEFNAIITFHPKDKVSIEQLAFLIKSAAIEVSEKVMELDIPFVTYKPISEYTPNTQ